jgi:hypothetical protein
LIADGVWITAALGGLALDSGALFVLAGFSYVLGPPCVHWVNSTGATGFASLAMRVSVEARRQGRLE